MKTLNLDPHLLRQIRQSSAERFARGKTMALKACLRSPHHTTGTEAVGRHWMQETLRGLASLRTSRGVKTRTAKCGGLVKVWRTRSLSTTNRQRPLRSKHSANKAINSFYVLREGSAKSVLGPSLRSSSHVVDLRLRSRAKTDSVFN